MFKNQHNNFIEDPEVFELVEQVDKRIDRIQQLLDMKRSEASKRFRLFLANLIDNYLDIRNNNNNDENSQPDDDEISAELTSGMMIRILFLFDSI